MTICIIPARSGSRRIPKKNIKPFFGKPIIVYSIETAQAAGCDVYVSTDDDDIGRLATKHGAHWHPRSNEMARDEVGTQEVAANALIELEIDKSEKVIVLYPCAPLVTTADLSIALARLDNVGGFVVAVGARPLRDAGAFYAGYCGEFIDRQPLYDDLTMLHVLPEERVCDINFYRDWAEAEMKYKALHPTLFETTDAI